MLALMFRSRARRMKRIRQAAGKSPQSMRRVSDQELFEQSQGVSVNGTQVFGVSGVKPRTVVSKPN